MKEVDRLFAEPPAEAKAAVITELEEREAALRQSIHNLHTEAADAKKAVADTLDRWKTYAALEHIDDYLRGGITHFVRLDYCGVTIHDAESALKQDDDNWRKDQKLLTLFGDTKGNLKWMLNRYRDGSGNWEYVYPCRSYDEAMEKATEVINGRFDEWRADHTKGWPNYAADSARKLGIKVPDDLAAFLRDAAIKSAQSRIDDALKRLADAEAAMARAAGDQP